MLIATTKNVHCTHAVGAINILPLCPGDHVPVCVALLAGPLPAQQQRSKCKFETMVISSTKKGHVSVDSQCTKSHLGDERLKQEILLLILSVKLSL